MTVYLLHFDRRISENHTCQHYLGSASNLNKRLALHKSGKGARLTQVANERGIEYSIVRTWEGDRTLERKLKKQKNAPRLCPVCRELRNVEPLLDMDGDYYHHIPTAEEEIAYQLYLEREENHVPVDQL